MVRPRLNLPCSIEVLAILIREIDSLSRNEEGEHTWWDTLWREMTHFLLVTGKPSAPGNEPFLYFKYVRYNTSLHASTLIILSNTPRHINFGRCPEYDRCAISYDIVVHPDYSQLKDEILPYQTLWIPMVEFEDLLDEDNDEISAATVDSRGLSWDKSNKKRLNDARQYVKHSTRAMRSQRGLFRCSASPKYNFKVRQTSLNQNMEEYMMRRYRYPVGGIVDAAMTVIIEDFHRTLNTYISSEREIQDHFLFFKSPESIIFFFARRLLHVSC